MNILPDSDVNAIDFVLPWVDGSDPLWLEQFTAHTRTLTGDKRDNRYRDWDNLQYLFRGMEKFTPWVRKIHFVTWGHLPPWLNTEHEKLHIVNHQDFLDEKNLPVFNCNPIEVNLHRIAGLAEKFVYFNDDTFLLKKISPERYFREGLPCDLLAFNAIYDSPIAHLKINDIQCLHRYFDKSDVVMRNFFKIFNFRTHFIEVLKTLLLMPWPKLTGFFDPHQPQPFLKKTFSEVWAKEGVLLNQTSASKIRSCTDVNQYLFRYWQLCAGDFHPCSYRKSFSKMIETDRDVEEFCHKIASGRYEMVCINDNIADDNLFVSARQAIAAALAVVFPEKSSFEK